MAWNGSGIKSILPNEDQKQILAAVGRVLTRNAGQWNAQRSGNVLKDLSEARNALASVVGRGTSNGEEHGPRVRKFWGWGYEGEGPDPLMVEVFLELLKLRFGLDGYEDIPTPRIDDIELRPPRFGLPDELQAFCTDAKLDRAAHSYGKAFRA